MALIDEILADSPVGVWKLNEASGSTAADSSGHGYDGVFSSSSGGVLALGHAALLAGLTDTAVTLDGQPGIAKIEIPNFAAFNGTATIALEAVATVPGSGDGEVDMVTKEDVFSLGFSGDAPYCGGYFAGVWHSIAGPSLVTGDAHHFGAEYDGANMTLFVDGAVVATVAITGALSANTKPVRLGEWSDSTGHFNGGAMQYGAFYDHALGQTRWQAHSDAAHTAGAGGGGGGGGGAGAPANTVPPTITGGTVVGDVLTVHDGTWTNTPTSFSYQWKVGGQNVVGATSNTFTVRNVDFGGKVSCRVTATNASGSASATSASTATVTATGPLVGIQNNINGGGSQADMLAFGPQIGREDTPSVGTAGWYASNGIVLVGIAYQDLLNVAAAPGVNIWEADNEPYTVDGHDAAWVTSLRDFCKNFKAAHPDKTLLLPLNVFRNNGDYFDPVDGTFKQWAIFLNTYAPDIWQYVDGIAGHPYVKRTNFDPPLPSHGFDVIDRVQAYLTSIGVNLPWHITEVGWPTGGTDGQAVTEAEQNTYIGEFLDEAVHVREYPTVVLYRLDDLAPSSSSESYYGLIEYGGTDKPAYATARGYIGATVAAPANSVAPAITGTPTVGQTLSVDNGTWTGTPTSFSYQWKRGGVAIAGATSNRYTLVGADGSATITVTVTATNTGGSASATSAGVGPVAVPASPTNVTLPAISGAAIVGQTLSVSNGAWSGAPTSYAYQWLRNGVAIGGATTSRYTLVSADAGTTITASVTATNSGGSTPATSAGAGPVTAASSAPTSTVAPAITGTPTVGSTLSGSNGTWANTPTGYTYRWLRNGVAIPGATAATYVLQTADTGAAITFEVTATNAAGSGVADSDPVKPTWVLTGATVVITTLAPAATVNLTISPDQPV